MGSAISSLRNGPQPEDATCSSSSASSDENSKRKFAEVLRFVALSEETRLMNSKKKGPSFSKEHCGGIKNAKDWKKNHYLFDDKDGEYGVILSSYDLDILGKILEPISAHSLFSVYGEDIIQQKAVSSLAHENHHAAPSGNTQPPPYWLKFNRPSYCKPPEIPDCEPCVREKLEDLKKYHDCNADLSGALREVQIFDRLPKPKGAERDEVRDFVISSLEYSIEQKLQPLYKTLFDWQATVDQEASELVLGFGHVRMVYTNKGDTSKKKKEETKIVNGPLVEVHVEAKLQEDGSIAVCPRNDARVKVNVEVMSALITGGGGNSKIVKDLHRKVEGIDPKSLLPGKSDTYLSFLEKAKNLCCNGAMRSIRHPATHDPPDDPSAMILTEAWCLYSRPKMSSVYSRDARGLAEALDKGKLKMPKAAYALTEGPGVLDRSSRPMSRHQVDELVFPLPASKTQRQVLEKLVEQKEPILVVQGPPGTGKTHTIVNCIGATLCQARTVLVTSNNPRALQALTEKLPRMLRMLCVDMSKCKEGSMIEFHKALEGMQIALSNVKEHRGEFEKEIETCRQNIKSKKEARSKIDQKLESASNVKRRLIESDQVKHILVKGLDVNAQTSWIVGSALLMESFDDILHQVQSLLQDQGVESRESLSFVYVGVISEELVALVSNEARRASCSTQAVDEKTNKTVSLASVFRFGSASPAMKLLSMLKVDGRSPASGEDWCRVLRGIRLKKKQCNFRHDHIEPLLQRGCCEKDIYDQDGVTIRGEFIEVLQKGRDLKRLFDMLLPRDRADLQNLCMSSSECRTLQGQRRELTAEIQILESEFVFTKVMVGLSQSLSQEAHSKLNQLTHIVGKAKNCSTSTSSGRALRHQCELRETLKETLPFLPFVMMTDDQVSAYVPLNHTFGLGILDEASQSDATALTTMARCEQWLVVGDDKQVSPTENFWREESINSLTASLPNIPPAQQLLPSCSFFDLCKVAFPSSHLFLQEHFRCAPEIIAFSNDHCYHGRLELLRLPSKESALVDIRVEGEKDKSKKTNRAEGEKIAQLVHDEIKKAAEGSSPPQTIGIISLGGPDQCKLIDNCLEDKIDPLRIAFGSKAVENHNILIGEPSQFQGAERDIVFLSTVYCEKYVHHETNSARRKQWNVAMSRAKHKMCLVRSFDIKHIKNKNDMRRDIFSFFLNARNTSTPVGTQEESHVPRGMPHSCIQTKIEDILISSLTSRGFEVGRKGGSVWSHSLCIGHQRKSSSASALVCIENAGESKQAWAKTLDQQMCLERAGTACLRVDCLSFVLNVRLALQEVLVFLAEAGLPELSVQDHALGAHAVSDPSDSERESEPGASGAKRKHYRTNDIPGPKKQQRNRGDLEDFEDTDDEE